MSINYFYRKGSTISFENAFGSVIILSAIPIKSQSINTDVPGPNGGYPSIKDATKKNKEKHLRMYITV